MVRFFGKIGFGIAEENPPESGVWVEVVVEKSYYGDLTRNARQLQNGDKVNSDLSVSNSISVVADPYANNHFHTIKYVEWAGARWTVSDVDASQPPRLILRLGVVYNGPTPAVAPAP